jgi:hypothetical protein
LAGDAKQASVNSDAQGVVERMIGEGAPFEAIEHYIDALPLPSEQLGALWLLAWAEATDPVTRRQVVSDALAGAGDPPRSKLAAAPSPAARAGASQRRLVFLRHDQDRSRAGAWRRRRTR